MSITREFFPIETTGLNTPPVTIVDDQWFISGDTPEGAWANFDSPPFLVFGNTTTGSWSSRTLNPYTLYYDTERRTLFSHDSTDLVGASNQAMSGSVVYTTDSDYTVTNGDWLIVITNTTGAAITISLPAIDVQTNARELIVIADQITGNSSIELDPAGTDTIFGSGLWSMSRWYDSVSIVADNTPATKRWHSIYRSDHKHSLADLDGGIASVDLDTTQDVLVDAIQEHTTNSGVTVDGLQIKDSRIAIYDEQIFQARKTGDQTLTASWVPLTWWSAAAFSDSIFSWDSSLGELTVNATTTIEVGYHVSFEETVGTVRSTPQARIARWIPSAFNALPGTQQATYVRNVTDAYGYVECSVFNAATSGYRFRIEVSYLNLGAGSTVVADRTNLRFWARRVNRA